MTQPPWTPEIVVGPELALALVRSQFPALAATDARPLGAGWDNTAYLVGDVVFRFPRRTSTLPLLEREVRLLPRIAGALPLPVPVPEWVGAPSPAYRWPFAGHRRLPGTPASQLRLSERELGDAAAPLGEFLAVLHGLAGAELPLPGDEIGRLDLPARLPLACERLAALAARGLVADPKPLLGLLESAPSPEPGAEVPVHGDVYAAHLLVDGGRLSGVIDWGDAHLGHPAADLMVLWTFLPRSARASFLQAYGRVGEATLALARARATFHSIGTAHYAAETGDAALLGASLAALDRVLEE